MSKISMKYYRWALPLAFVVVDGVPLLLPPVMGRGFLADVEASADARGAASFITILA